MNTATERRADLGTALLIGAGVLVIPLTLNPWYPSPRPSEDPKRFTLELLGAAVLIALALRPWGVPLRDTVRSMVAAILLAVWLVITSVLAEFPLIHLDALWPVLVGILLFLAIQIVDLSARQVAAWWHLLGLSATIACLLAVLPSDVIPWQMESGRWSHSSTFANPLSLAEFLAPVTCLAVARLWLAPRGRPMMSLITLLVLALGLVVMLLTASRGPVLGFLAGLAVIAVMGSGKTLLRGRALAALAIALCVLVGAHLALGAKSPARNLVSRFAQTFNSEHHSTRHRLAIWSLDVQMVARSPLLGHGWGSHEFLFQPLLLENLRDDPDGHWEGVTASFDGNIAYHSHCDYLELAVAAGIPGLLLFVWILVSALLRGGRGLRVASPDARWVIGGGIAALICLAVIALVSFPLHRIAQGMVLWIALGICCRAPRLAQPPR